MPDMRPFSQGMYVIPAQATATDSPDSAFAEHEIRSAIIIVLARHRRRAHSVAIERFEAGGWTDVRSLSIGDLGPDGVDFEAPQPAHDAFADATTPDLPDNYSDFRSPNFLS